MMHPHLEIWSDAKHGFFGGEGGLMTYGVGELFGSWSWIWHFLLAGEIYNLCVFLCTALLHKWSTKHLPFLSILVTGPRKPGTMIRHCILAEFLNIGVHAS